MDRDEVHVRRLGAGTLVLFGPGFLDAAMIDRFQDALVSARARPPGDLVLHPQFIPDRLDEAVGDLVAFAETLHDEGWEVGLVIDEPVVRAAVASVSCAHVDRSLPLALSRVLRAPTVR